MVFLLTAGQFLVIAAIWISGGEWWDQQRIYELVILLLAALFAIRLSLLKLPKPVFWLLAAFLIFGLAASVFSSYPWYALKEWGLYLGLFVFTLLLANNLKDQRLQYVLLVGMSVSAGLNAYQFLLHYLMAFVSGLYLLNADLLFNGFSNPRFLNQFQGLLIPILGYLILYFWRGDSRYRKLVYPLLFTVLATQWCIAFTLGGRSLWIGLGMSHLALLLFFRRFWRLLLIQLLAMAVGAMLFYLLFFLIPDWAGLESKIRTSLRVTSSGRIELWSKAFAVYLQSPWLGVGPMHLAEHWHLRFASPHQTVLQLLAEWGPVSALIAIYLAALGMFKGLQRLRRSEGRYLDAALWLALATALVMAQFEGVFNAPYTQIWLAILIAIALARWLPEQGDTEKSGLSRLQTYAWKLCAVVVFCISAIVLFIEVPTLAEDSQYHIEKHGTGYVPRYWLQGWIPMEKAAP